VKLTAGIVDDKLSGLVVVRWAMREEPPTLEPGGGSLVVPERRREDADLVSAIVPFDEVCDILRRLSCGRGVGRVVELLSGCCCWSLVEAKGRPLVSQGSDIADRGDETTYILEPEGMGPGRIGAAS
jgi:hypothetical protein